jgi:lysophospholipid acyltransferase (LPLAT)-like uncharacterized protein
MEYIKNRLDPWKLKSLGWLLTSIVGAVAFTWRVRFIGSDYVNDLTEKGKPFVLVFWHGDMLMGWYFHRNRKYSSLVSKSKDGDILAEILRQWRYIVIRGSSSKGGRDARLQMEKLVRSGQVLVVTPDGPRGPRYEMKMGALRTAQKTGVPVVSVTFKVKHAYILRSWDKFTVPLPFTKIIVQYKAPEIINPELNGDALDEYREEFQEGMKPGIVGA